MDEEKKDYGVCKCGAPVKWAVFKGGEWSLVCTSHNDTGLGGGKIYTIEEYLKRKKRGNL